MKYICKYCGATFIEPYKEKEIIGVDNQTGLIEYEYCPRCKSDDIEIKEVSDDDE